MKVTTQLLSGHGRRRSGSIIAFFAVLFFIFVPKAAEAQTGTDGARDFSLFVGYLLPNQIENVSEILPLFGGRYTFGWPIGAVELSAENAHAEGVSWTSIGASLRAEMPIAPGISSLIYGGPSFHYYRPEGDTERRADFGVHFGVAGLMLVSDTFWLRSDLKFLGGPGTALYLLVGFMFRAPGSG